MTKLIHKKQDSKMELGEIKSMKGKFLMEEKLIFSPNV